MDGLIVLDWPGVVRLSLRIEKSGRRLRWSCADTGSYMRAPPP